jgi:cytochrome c-type biogenesis protein CcmH
MIFWSLAIVATAITCAALYYAGARRGVNATASVVDSPEVEHLKLQLKEIDADLAAGRLAEAEAVAAKGELARELIRLKSAPQPAPQPRGRTGIVAVAALVTGLLTFGIYGVMGRPDLPAQPLALRADIPPPQMTLEDAVARIEAQLELTPDDVRGWIAIAPAYMQMGRFADAAAALRRVIALEGPTADRETDLGEALMMANNGDASGEPLALFESAAGRDPQHVRSRYYMAGEAMREGEFETAKTRWEDLLALATGEEPWVANARAGLDAADAGLNGPDDEAIAGMVEGLSARLFESGGTVEEWTRLVRSRLVLGQTAEAQAAYEAARRAHPDPSTRGVLDVLAADNGLVASN